MTPTEPTPALPLKALPWESTFVARMPGDPETRNFTRRVRSVCYSEVAPTPVRAPRLIGWSDSIARELGVSRPAQPSDENVELLAGNHVLPGMRPYAARYGGHQFGNWAGQLGDGRAITLGEVRGPSGRRFELQLKGAGPTPYSRRADGRAVLRSSVREFLCSEAMHFLGVPTTRALSLVTTGDDVVRDLFYDGNPKAEPGAIVCRVAPSFLRFGNFEILASSQEPELLKSLTDLLIEDHYPELDRTSPDVYAMLLDEIARRTAHMIAHWMRVGFVHGVMNTDNMSVLGLTIDYGPYGWLEPFDPDWTPNTTDAEGRRYRFGNQPGIALWNLTRLAESWLPLIKDEDRLHQSLVIFRDTFESVHEQMLAQKLGLPTLHSPLDSTLADDLVHLLVATETDYTVFFRALCDWRLDSPPTALPTLIAPAFYSPESLTSDLLSNWQLWAQRYTALLRASATPDATRSTTMKLANPKYVLRNYLAQTAITAAESGDPTVLQRLLTTLQTPYDDQPTASDLAEKRPEWARNAPGCSALSCSS